MNETLYIILMAIFTIGACIGIALYAVSFKHTSAKEKKYGIITFAACLTVLLIITSFRRGSLTRKEFDDSVEKGYTFYMDGYEISPEAIEDPVDYFRVEVYDDAHVVWIRSKKFID